MFTVSLALAGVQPASPYVPDATESFAGFSGSVPSGTPILDTEGSQLTTDGLFGSTPLGVAALTGDPPAVVVNLADVFQTGCVDFGAEVRRVGFELTAPSPTIAEVTFTDANSATFTESVVLAGFAAQQLDWEHDGTPLVQVCVRAADDISIIAIDDVRIQRQRSLDCTPLDDASCEVVNLAANLINETGGTVILQSAAPVARFRSEALYADLAQLRTAALAADCTEFDGAHGGTYQAFDSWEGGWSSRDLTASGLASGGVDRSPRTFAGTLTGDVSAPVGFSFTRYNTDGQAVADTGNGVFLAGHWVRTQGRNGFYVLGTGLCDGAVAPSFDPWFQGPLP